MAVFTPVDLDQAKAYLKAYDIGQLLHLEGIEEGVSNTNFKVETTKGLYALTLFEAATPAKDLPYFMDYTHHLDAKGYPAPGPEPMRSGAILGELNDKPCALIKWLPGRWPRDPSPKHAQSAGHYLAKLHILGADFAAHRDNSMGMAVWPHLIERCYPKAHESLRACQILESFKADLHRLIEAWPEASELPRGAIHADYFTDNVLMSDEGEVTGVIDYYYACTDFYAYDLAVALNAWGFSPGGQYLGDMYQAFLAGYQALRPLEPKEKAALSLFLRGSAIRFTLTRLYDLLHHDPSWVVKPKDPEAFFRRWLYHAQSAGLEA